MIILGIDPGYGIVGWGVIEKKGYQFRPIAYGAIKTPPKTDIAQRINTIYEEVSRIIETYHPDDIAIEELFFNTNITTGIQVGHARGVILLAGKQKGVSFNEYTPSQVKQSVVGYGKAEKRQVMEMTRQLLGLERIPRPDDAADALALAICHAHSSKSNLVGLKL